MIIAGVDAGSRAIKIVLFDSKKEEVMASGIMDQGVAQNALAKELYENLLRENGLAPEEIAQIVATGYGRNLISFANKTITEITCHASGVRHLVPDARTILEIGGQDSKVIRLYPNGSVQDFNMNDRCAAGTGRFLEVVAERLDVKLNALGKMARQSRRPASISSMCVVFAETEIIGLLATNISPDDIAAGVQASIATRVASMSGRSIQPPIVFTGGVAMIPGMDSALENVLEQEVIISPVPQMTGALGAALLV